MGLGEVVDAYRNALALHDWEPYFVNDDVDVVCELWTNEFMNISKRYIPNRIATIRPKDKPYYTNNHRRAKRKLDRVHKQAKLTNANDDWAKYRELRNEYISELRISEAAYEQKLASSLQTSNNVSPKRWWSVAKSFLGIQPNYELPAMESDDGKIISDNTLKADEFNRFFLSQSNINTNLAKLPTFMDKGNGNKLNDIRTSPDEVCDILQSLKTNKATGPDGVSAKLLREAAPSIAKPLSKIINLSLQTCKIPRLWKQANVVPVYKKDDKSKFSNYRPISLLSCSGKVMEKVIFKHVFNFIRDNDLLSKLQSGFMPGDSTVNQLVHLYHMFARAIDQKKEIRAVFCDISKAFDRVWHKGLLLKLNQIGIDGMLLSLFRNYLTNRQQRVTIKGESSNWGTIKAGVPQGSILGPLLFLIFINDITEGISSNIRLFADDTTLFVTVDDHEQASATLNCDLELLNAWAERWLVKFNAKKTKSMLFSNKRNPITPNLVFGNATLENVNEHTHLGLGLNTTLGLSSHIQTICDKANKRVDIMSRLSYKLDRKTLYIMYKSFIRPVMEYACVVWDGCTQVDANRLEAIQLRAGRIVCGAIRHTLHAVIYDELGWETLSKRR